MKKTNVFIAACAAALLSSCASYQQTAPVMAIGGNNIITNVAAELDYKSVKRIEGTVETQTLFGFNLVRNANKTLKNNNRYRGLNKRESQALYKAKTEAGVDIILEPEFETEKHSWFLGAYKTSKTKVKGWGVNIRRFKEKTESNDNVPFGSSSLF